MGAKVGIDKVAYTRMTLATIQAGAGCENVIPALRVIINELKESPGFKGDFAKAFSPGLDDILMIISRLDARTRAVKERIVELARMLEMDVDSRSHAKKSANKIEEAKSKIKSKNKLSGK